MTNNLKGFKTTDNHWNLDEGTRLWKTQLHEFPYAIDLARAARSTGDPRFSEQLLALIRSWTPVAHIGRRGFAHDVWDPRGVSSRLMVLSRVDLPAPLGPSRTTKLPAAISSVVG